MGRRRRMHGKWRSPFRQGPGNHIEAVHSLIEAVDDPNQQPLSTQRTPFNPSYKIGGGDIGVTAEIDLTKKNDNEFKLTKSNRMQARIDALKKRKQTERRIKKIKKLEYKK